MKLISLGDIDSADYDCVIKNISAINLVPKNRILSHEAEGRMLNGFLYLLEGQCRYEFCGKVLDLEPGALIYLPKGSKHRYMALSDTVRYIRVDFTACDPDGEEIIFTENPFLFFGDTPYKYASLIEQTAETFISGAYGNNFKIKALLYELLGALSAHCRNTFSDNVGYSQILPSIRYIEENYRSPLTTNELADMCHLSGTHFRRVFKSVTGMTPTEYRTKIRIEKACMLLGNKSCSINELAEQLGFESVYYFSRVFRKIVGISPGKYRRGE